MSRTNQHYTQIHTEVKYLENLKYVKLVKKTNCVKEQCSLNVIYLRFCKSQHNDSAKLCQRYARQHTAARYC